VVNMSKYSCHMEEESMTQISLQYFVDNIELKGISPLDIVHKRMEWLKERIIPS
jgi:hypothetical protein